MGSLWIHSDVDKGIAGLYNDSLFYMSGVDKAQLFISIDLDRKITVTVCSNPFRFSYVGNIGSPNRFAMDIRNLSFKSKNRKRGCRCFFI